jgi:hypothetical protein
MDGRLAVAHEPLQSRYRSDEHYRSYENTRNALEQPDIAEHLEDVRDVLAGGRPYLETGWQAYGVLPMLAEQLAPDFALLHLVRHPVTTALSFAATVAAWSAPGWRARKWKELTLPHPETSPVLQPELAGRFADLEPFEQSLFWWTEIQLYAEELRSRFPGVPFERVHAEDLFVGDPESLERLGSLIGLDLRGALTASRSLDEHAKSGWVGDWRKIFDHPAALRMSAALGYDPAAVDAAELQRRYPS